MRRDEMLREHCTLLGLHLSKKKCFTLDQLAYGEKPKFVTSFSWDLKRSNYINAIHEFIAYSASAKPASCESDKDCLKEQAKCIR